MKERTCLWIRKGRPGRAVGGGRVLLVRGLFGSFPDFHAPSKVFLDCLDGLAENRDGLGVGLGKTGLMEGQVLLEGDEVVGHGWVPFGSSVNRLARGVCGTVVPVRIRTAKYIRQEGGGYHRSNVRYCDRAHRWWLSAFRPRRPVNQPGRPDALMHGTGARE